MIQGHFAVYIIEVHFGVHEGLNLYFLPDTDRKIGGT